MIPDKEVYGISINGKKIINGHKINMLLKDKKQCSVANRDTYFNASYWHVVASTLDKDLGAAKSLRLRVQAKLS